MRRRLLPAGLAFLVLTGLFLVLPVFSAPRPKPVPVKTLAQEVPMGSVTAPAPGATIASGATQPGRAAPSAARALTVTRTHLKSFSMVGVTWAADPAVTDVVVRVRVQRPSGTWGTWTQVASEDASPDAGAASGRKQRGGTAPLWTGPTTGVQAELAARSGAQPSDAKLDLIDPGSSAADSTLGAPDIQDQAHAASPMPAIHSRAQWGADESIRTWDPEYASTIKAATIHHSADSNDYTAAQVPALMRSIYRYHTVNRGWGDIGYNVIVDKFGGLWEGRYGGLASTVIGAHAGGFNTYTFGVSMLGNYEEVDTPAPMIASVGAVVHWKLALYGVDPLGKTTLTSAGGGTAKYNAGVKVTLPTIFAHRDVGATLCPGKYGYARMDQIRLSMITQRYDSDAALRTLLGAQTAAPVQTPGGTGGVAKYEHGALYYSRAGGVRVESGTIGDYWTSLGAQTSPLGFPTGDVTPAAHGVGSYATFEHGAIFSSPTSGTRVVKGPVQTLFTSLGAEQGALGYPTTSTAATGDGVGQFQQFEEGSIFWSPKTGARVVQSPVLAAWTALGAEHGALGYPTSSTAATGDKLGRYQHFERGSIFWSQATDAHALVGPIKDLWASLGYERGSLGYPTGDVTAAAVGGGSYATFEKGSIFWSPKTGARVVQGPVLSAWTALGAEQSALGYPTTGTSVTGDKVGRYQHFERGSIFWSPSTDAHALVGPIRDLWASLGYERGALGYPTSDVIAAAVGGGSYATFEKGSIFWSPKTGARVVQNPVLAAWTARDAEHGALGYPTTGTSVTGDKVGRYQHFEKGSIFWSPSTDARALVGPVRDLWASLGYERSALGYPTSDVLTAADGVGRYATFQNGSIFWSLKTGARVVQSPVLSAWTDLGAEHGALGYPTSSTAATGDKLGRYQHFEKGSIFWSQATNAHAVVGPIRDLWASLGYERGRLGYPTRDAYPVSGGSRVDFQHGYITLSAGKATAVHP